MVAAILAPRDMPKELVPIVLAVAFWGPQWAGTKICCRCDNSAVVLAINVEQGSTKDPKLMRLLHICFFFAMYRISITVCHLPGVQNSLPMHSSTIIQSCFMLSILRHHRYQQWSPKSCNSWCTTGHFYGLLWTGPSCSMLPWNVHHCFHTCIVLLCPALLHELLQQI